MTNKRKAIGGAIAAIVLGAFGSGLYELTKPLLWWVWKFVLTISTLGMTSLRDGLYEDAAQLSYGMMSNTSTFLIFAVITLATSTILILNYLNEPKFKFLYLFFASLFLLLTGSSMIKSTKSSYVEKIYKEFRMLNTIAAPYITELDRKKIMADFARVKTRQNYIEISNKLIGILKANKIEVPEREWY